jgi:carbamoyltransferase
MITWGISANSHDAALAVFNDDGLEFASHSERFSGIKNDAHLNDKLVQYAQRWGEPDEIIWYEKPFRKTLRQLSAGQGFNFRENNIRNYLAGYEVHAPIRYVDHHLSHAAAGFYTSGFREATVTCIDSIGEFETLSIWQGNETGLKRIYSQSYPHSLGLWYSAFTQRIGLKPQEDEYILMGMAAYGDPLRFFDEILQEFFYPIDSDSLRNIFFPTPRIKLKHNLHRGCLWWRPELNSPQDLMDIAAAVQAIYAYLLKYVSNWARWKSPSGNLVLMGGCALNCVANYNIMKRLPPEINLYVDPLCGDDGISMGAAKYQYKIDSQKDVSLKTLYLGQQIEYNYQLNQNESEKKVSPKEVAELISKGNIVAICQGRSESGPRALGNRSILFDPRVENGKEIVNRVKKREWWRPFAGTVLWEHCKDWFDMNRLEESPYMMYAVDVWEDKRSIIPSITHVDGTCRIQTLKKQHNPNYYELIEEFYKLTEVPILFNTSFNLAGDTIVETIDDAFNTLRNSEIEYMYLPEISKLIYVPNEKNLC